MVRWRWAEDAVHGYEASTVSIHSLRHDSNHVGYYRPDSNAMLQEKEPGNALK